VCQHRTPEVTWRADHLEQPNGACGVAEVVGVAADLPAIEVAYGVIFGDRLSSSAHAVAIEAGTARITFLPPAAFAARFAPFGDAIGAPRLGALRLRTASLRQTREVLSANGVRHAETDDGTLLVGPDEACGTILEFAAS
jgi:hypothetical protein